MGASGEPGAQDPADGDAEREAWGMDAQAWNDAFAWADEPVARSDADPQHDGPFAVWRCNWEAVGCWMALLSPWRVSPTGRVLGLDYTAVEVVMRRRKVADGDVMFAQLQTMERAALEVLHG